MVMSEQGIVLGLLREKELSSDPDVEVEQVMRNGPTTFRPNEPTGKMAKRMRERGSRTVLVTTSDGKLVGVLYREDAERLAGEQVE